MPISLPPAAILWSCDLQLFSKPPCRRTIRRLQLPVAVSASSRLFKTRKGRPRSVTTTSPNQINNFPQPLSAAALRSSRRNSSMGMAWLPANSSLSGSRVRNTPRCWRSITGGFNVRSGEKLRSLRPLSDQSVGGAHQAEERAEDTGNWVRFAECRNRKKNRWGRRPRLRRTSWSGSSSHPFSLRRLHDGTPSASRGQPVVARPAVGMKLSY